jgi:hypothetical protein
MHFGAGTAATIAPIIQIGYRDKYINCRPWKEETLSANIKEDVDKHQSWAP